jgi:RNA polymerase sigma-70 factor (ECF subfamily)
MEQVFREHSAFVMRTARRLGVSAGDLDDVAQEVFMVIHRKLPDFDPTTPLRAWLFGIVRNAACDYRKKAYRKREVAGVYEVCESPSPDQEAILEIEEARRILDRAMDGLDEEKRAVFVLYQLENIPMKEVALAVGCPLQTAYSRLAAAREKVEAYVNRCCKTPGSAR